MSELPVPTEMQSRLEHSRSIEDAERFRAIDTLKELGLLLPVTDVETFHGRLGKSSDESVWQVDPGFANGSNDSGNINVNRRPTLYTGDRDTAQDFAKQRGGETIRSILRRKYKEEVKGYTADQKKAWLIRLNQSEKERWDRLDQDQRKYYPKGQKVYRTDELDEEYIVHREANQLEERLTQEEREANWKQVAENFRVEVHNIASADPDATVLDFGFDSAKLGDEEKVRYEHALKALLIPITEGSPVGFEHRDVIKPFAEVINRLRKSFLTTEDVATIVAESGIDAATADLLAGAYNARQIAAIKPSYLVSQLIKNRHNIISDTLDVNGEKQEIPLNLEYVERYLRLAHIVGVKQSISSATLGRDITSVSFFDLERTKTVETHEAERRATWQKLGGVATALSELLPAEAMPRDQLHALLQDAHAKPEKLVAAAKSVEGFGDIFDADAGNWEGFTLGEHTETVLRNFDENFADKIPVEFLAPMRLAIISHDVGKPVAAANGEKHLQKKYNALQADDFLTKAGVDERLKGILLAVIGEGADLAYKIDIRGAGDAAVAELESLARDTLSKFGSGVNIDGQIAGFVEMCKMIQICDGGAYTSMAITNRRDGRGKHRNAPSFNSSFAKPVGLGKRDIRLRQDEESHAPHDLTPKAAEQQSRVKMSHRGAGRKPPTIST
jgi:hypothetical protein